MPKTSNKKSVPSKTTIKKMVNTAIVSKLETKRFDAKSYSTDLPVASATPTNAKNSIRMNLITGGSNEG